MKTTLTHETKKALNTIVDMSSDGSTYTKLRSLLLEMETKAETGDKAAEEIIKITRMFGNLVEVAKNS